MYMMYVMHHAFRRDLAAFAAAAPRTPVEDRVAWRPLAAALGASSPRRCTTTTPARTPASGRCCSSAAPTRTRETLEAMEAEHAEIDPLLEACAAGFARLAEHADDDARAALAVRLAAARECLGRHLEHEETERDRDPPAGAHPGGLGAPRRGALQGGPDARQGRPASCRGRRTACPREVLDARVRQDRARLQGWSGWLTRRRFAAPGGARLPARRLSAEALEAEPLPLAAQPLRGRAGPPTPRTAGRRRRRAGWRGPARRSPRPPSPGRRRPDRSTVPEPAQQACPANGSSRA